MEIAGKRPGFFPVEIKERESTPGDAFDGAVGVTHIQDVTTVTGPQKAPESIPPGEFPNYFFRHNPEDAKRIETKVNEALASILKRLQVFHVDPATNKITSKGFFDKLNAKIQKKDPDAKVSIAAGVVRSLLSYLYKKVYHEHQRNETYDPKATEKVLDRVIKGACRKTEGVQEDKELATLSALGIGSDLDILIEYSDGTDDATKKAIERDATDFINSAEKHFDLRSAKESTLKKTLVPVGDVKEYHAQIDRATKQGGSTLDWLAFPIPKANEKAEEIRMPDEHKYIMPNFFKGQVAYKESNTGNPDKQTIRGLRPLLELPFLHLTERGKNILVSELEVLLEKMKKGTPIDKRAQSHFVTIGQLWP